MLKQKGVTMETVQYLGRDYRPTLDLITAKKVIVSRAKSNPGESSNTDHLYFF